MNKQGLATGLCAVLCVLAPYSVVADDEKDLCNALFSNASVYLWPYRAHVKQERFMNRLTKTIVATAIIAAAPLAAQADSGLYVGGSFGSATLDERFDDFLIDTDANAYRLFGGLQLGDSLAIEAGYLDLGEFSESVDIGGLLSRADISGDGWTLGAKLGLPLSDSLSLFGHGGVFFWDADISIDGFSIDTPGDENPYYGAGLQLDLSRNLALTGDWTRYELDSVDTDVISLGIQYRFGR